jgi:uncharacterized protein
MTVETLDEVFLRINEYLETMENNETIDLVWHGGEPLLLGVSYFREALELQMKRCRSTSKRINHSVQTNLTLLTQDFIGVFREMGINSIGTSYEPLPGIRGLGKHADSQAYDEHFFRGLRLLKENNFGWGFIYVVTRRALQYPLRLFFFLSNLAMDKGFALNPVLLYGKDPDQLGITPNEYVEFLGSIFPVWWAHRERWPSVDPFAYLVKVILQKKNCVSCVDSGNCHAHHVYVGPEGELSQCGRSADWDIVWYGNIHERSLRDVLSENEKNRQFVRRNEVLQEGECRGCRFWEICHGGCPLDSFPTHGDLLHKSEWCDAKRLFIEKYFEPVTGVRFEGSGPRS